VFGSVILNLRCVYLVRLVVPGTHTPQVQNYTAKHQLHTRKISRVISVKHVQTLPDDGSQMT